MFFRAWPAVGGTIDYRPWLPGGGPARGRSTRGGSRRELGEWATSCGSVASAWTSTSSTTTRSALHVRRRPRRRRGRRGAARRRGRGAEYVSSGAALIGQLLQGLPRPRRRVLHSTPGAGSSSTTAASSASRAERDGQPFAVARRGGVLLGTGGYATTRS